MKRLTIYFGIPLLVISLCACERNTTTSPEILNIKNYEIDQQVRCFCMSPPAWRFYRLTVENGEIVTGVDIEDGRNLSSENFDFFKTISQLLEFVDSIHPDSVAVFDIKYDSEFGFPSSIYVDFSHRIADEEIGYETRNFKPLP